MGGYHIAFAVDMTSPSDHNAPRFVMKKEHGLNDLGRDMKPHRSGARLRPLEVTVDEGGIERAIRKFTRAVAEDGVLKELKKRRHHVKPGQKRRIKEREAQRRRRKQTRVFRQKDRE